MNLSEPIREQAKTALVETYITHYNQYERYSLVAKDLAGENKTEAHRTVITLANRLSVFMDGFMAAAEVLGISNREFLDAVSQNGKEGDSGCQ